MRKNSTFLEKIKRNKVLKVDQYQNGTLNGENSVTAENNSNNIPCQDESLCLENMAYIKKNY